MKRTKRPPNEPPPYLVTGPGVSLFLDSGAYSAHTRGQEIDVHEYIDFIKRHLQWIDVYANLDVIGDAEATWKNQAAMEEAGLTPLPVYHIGEPPRFLDRCLEYSYFAIGGIAASNMRTRYTFLDRCFSKICDTPDRLPRAKVHGFGVTSIAHMRRYPWWSVDSTSWTLHAANGNIFVPERRNEKDRWDYTRGLQTVKVAARGRAEARRAVKAPTADHLEELPPTRQAFIRDFIEDKGFTIGHSSFKTVEKGYELGEGELWVTRPGDRKNGTRPLVVEVLEERGLCNVDLERRAFNADFLLEVAKTIPEWPWPFDRGTHGPGGSLGLA